MKKVLSLGAGVQSSTLALMCERGEFERPDCAIFADTQAEPASVYKWLEWLRSEIKTYPIHVKSYGNLEADTLSLRVSKKTGKLYLRTLVPFWVKKDNGAMGVVRRKCTRDYKVLVIERAIRKMVPRLMYGKYRRAESFIGISTDEADRMKPSSRWWIKNRWPLIEMGMSRQDCLDWMDRNGYPKPPRSACVFCPYHSDDEWIRLRDEEPEAFQRAVRYERENQRLQAMQESMTAVPYLHKSLMPLDVVQFVPGQGRRAMSAECEGMCGV